jgi:cytosine/creatinine deaminase
MIATSKNYSSMVLIEQSPSLSTLKRVAAFVQLFSGGIGYMTQALDYNAMLKVAIEEAKQGLAEGGIPIGAALFDGAGNLLGRGHNRRVQEQDPSMHAETDAFRKAGRKPSYRDKIMVTTLAPCWYCSGLVRQFKIGAVVVGESVNFAGGIEWLKENGVEVIDLNSKECVEMLALYISENPRVWNEDIGEQ